MCPSCPRMPAYVRTLRGPPPPHILCCRATFGPIKRKRRTRFELATSSLGSDQRVSNMACKSTTSSLTKAPVTALAPQTLPSLCAQGSRQAGGRFVALAVTNCEPPPAKTKDGRCDSHSIQLGLTQRAVVSGARVMTPSGGSRTACSERQTPRPRADSENVERSARPVADDVRGGSRTRCARANAAAIPVGGASRASSLAGWALPHPRGGACRVLASERDSGAPGPCQADRRETGRGVSAAQPVAILAAAAASGRELAGPLRPLDRGAVRAALPALLTPPLPRQRSVPASNG